jgi:sortase A
MRAFVNFIATTLVLLGLVAIGYYGYVVLETQAIQAYEGWAFRQEMSGKKASVGGYLGSLIDSQPAPPAPQASTPRETYIDPESWTGKIDIPRVKVSAIVHEGVDSRTLRRAVGHIPGTAFPGQMGNVGLAAHRDTFFRGLRDIRKDDVIRVESLQGIYEYQVESMKIVLPNRIDVLEAASEPTLTLVTCYPFNYVGKAPQRFIVTARQITPGKVVHPRGS